MGVLEDIGRFFIKHGHHDFVVVSAAANARVAQETTAGSAWPASTSPGWFNEHRKACKFVSFVVVDCRRLIFSHNRFSKATIITFAAVGVIVGCML
jgi:glutamate-1-semialdehyde aminotransferase